MARIPEIYLRPVNTPILSFSLESGSNTLDGWNRLEFGQKAVKYGIDKDVTEEYTDGTIGVGSEAVSLDFGTFRATKAHYDYLRAQFHNTPVDVLFYDPNDDSFLCAFWGVLLAVSPVAEGSTSIIVKMTAKRGFASLSLSGIATFAANTPSGVISGTVYNTDGTTPLSGVTVSVTGNSRTYSYVTDSDGNYLIDVYASLSGVTYTFTLTKLGKTFPSGQTLSVKQNAESTKNFTALT